jgi:hypothetical protein
MSLNNPGSEGLGVAGSHVRGSESELRRAPFSGQSSERGALDYSTRRSTMAEFLLPNAMQLATAHSMSSFREPPTT